MTDLSKEQMREISILYSEKLYSIKVLIKMFKIGENKLWRILKDFGIRKRGRQELLNRFLSPEQELEVINLYILNKLTGKEISSLKGFNKNLVFNTLARYKVRVRTQFDYPPIEGGEAAVFKEYEKGGTISLILKKFKMGRRRLLRILASRGVNLAKESENSKKSFRKKLSQEILKGILKEYLERKLPKNNLAKKLGIPISRLNRALKEFNCTEKFYYNDKVILDEAQEKEIISKFKDGLLIKEIIKSLSFSTSVRAVKRCICKFFPTEEKSFIKIWKDRHSPEVFNKLMENRCGKNSNLWGRPPSKTGGRGYSGWYKSNFYFRSLHELTFMLSLDEQQISWRSGEYKSLNIEYIGENGRIKNYWPDFIVNETKIVEIKPLSLQSETSVQLKASAAIDFCNKNGFVYEMIESKPDKIKIKKALQNGLVEFTKPFEEKFLKNLTKKQRLS